MRLDPAREVAPGVLLVDTGYIRPHLAACYVVRGAEGAAIVDSGSTRSVPGILEALAGAGVAPGDVSHVIVTHVHLDHAGGAGALLAALPRAQLVAHPRGARHMIDPSKLWAGTVGVYGEERTRALYGELVPAPAARVVEAGDGHVVDLGGRRLRFLDAPGHAKHHFVVLDEGSRGVFTGDVFGLSYREADSARGPFFFPTTTPVQFDPPALHRTIGRIMAERPERVFLTHYGMVEGDLDRHAAALLAGVDEHARRARSTAPGPGRLAAIRGGLEEQLLAGLAAHGAPLSRAEALELYRGDLDLNAQGLQVWLEASAAA